MPSRKGPKVTVVSVAAPVYGQPMSSRFSLGGLVQNLILSRTAYLRKLLDPRRDIGAECGHPDTILTSDYHQLFERGDIARRIVTLFPEESWKTSPSLVEAETQGKTALEKEWKTLEEELHIWSTLQRLDMLSGIGRFGVLLLGFNDGKPMSEPVDGTGNKLIYVRPFEEYFVDVSSLEGDETNPRFGQPSIYNIRFADTAVGGQQTQAARSISTHWTRVIHVADNRTNSDVYGTPRMQWVFNRVLDTRKVSGGSGEMFWKGGFPGLALEAQNIEEDASFDKESAKEQIEAYMNGLQRALYLTGMTAKSLAPQVADPTPHLDLQLRLVAAAIGCPMRVLLGSEQGELASGQDSKAWNTRVEGRRKEYITPFIIRPTIERLMQFGALPMSKSYEVKWPDLNTPSDEEKASVAEHKANALFKYVTGGVDALLPPFQFLTLVLGMTDEEARAIIKETGDRLIELDDPEEEPEEIPAQARITL